MVKNRFLWITPGRCNVDPEWLAWIPFVRKLTLNLCKQKHPRQITGILLGEGVPYLPMWWIYPFNKQSAAYILYICSCTLFLIEIFNKSFLEFEEAAVYV